jgi:predicted regulator of Ras-like GTPase activity (Roadblock/LC7/MglB family)
MATLPQLVEEDILSIDATLRDLLKQSEASTALIADKGGFLIASQGNSSDYDLTSIAALASGSFMASQSIAGLIAENTFTNAYQQGESYSLFIQEVDEHCLLLVIFPASVGVGAVKYFASAAAPRIARQMQAAQERDPSAGLDLSVLNCADTSGFFKRCD